MESFVANQTNSQSNVSPEDNPSIFEVLAQQSLANGLRKAAQYLTNILYSNNSQKFDFLYKNFDEMYLLFDICVQLSHLRAFSSSFSEHFYSLKRVSNDTKSELNRKQFLSSLVVLSAFPYIKSKFDSLYSDLKLRQMDRQLESDSNRQLKQIFVKTYPIFQTFCQLMSLYYQLSYTVGRNSYYSPLLRLSNVRLISLEEKDLRENYFDLQTIDSNIDWFRYLVRLSITSTKYLAKGFGFCLSFSAFFIQFLDFWYSSDTSPTSFAPMPIPPPPRPYKIEIPLERCPICLKVRQNDTALITTGFVFCYTCITNHLKQDNRCPVTGYPSTVEHLIKLYPPDH